MKKLNAFQIKIIMVIIMALDHIGYIPGIYPITLNCTFHVLSRCVGVWFMYLAVEGVFHTKSRRKYIMRLFTWAFIMFLGNTFFNYLFRSKGIIISNNIFLTIAIGVSMLCLLEYKKIPIILRYLGVAVMFVCAYFVQAEGMHTEIPFILITYYCRNTPKLRNIIYILLSALLFYISFVPYETITTTLEILAFNSDFMFITVILFIYLYNGKRGSNTKFAKYFFYIFYPAHLWLITIIAAII